MIELAHGLKLPDSAVTNSYALLAMKGAGKSNAAVVFAEELFREGIPWVCVDPKGDWWGIRSGSTGKRVGLPVPIFGGLHADVALDPNAGKLFADLIVNQHLTALIDVSEMTKGESVRFLTAFFDQLYRRKNRSTYPMHLFLEECDDYVPQKVWRDIAALVRTVELAVKRGRQRGLGITLASQRAASINKDVLTQTDTLIALRTTSPQDRKAILDWISWHAGAREIVDELPTLRDGEAWVSSPAQLRILSKVQFRRRTTFDSGATPELGEKVKAATLADIDVDAITAAVSDVVARAKATDPKLLTAEVNRLRRALGNAEDRIAELSDAAREVEVHEVVPTDVTDALRATLAKYDEAIGAMQSGRAVVAAALDQLHAIEKESPCRPALPAGPSASSTSGRSSRSSTKTPTTSTRVATAAANGSPTRLGQRERAILAVLAQHRDVSQRKLALLTGYSPKASTIGAGLSELRKAGFVSGMTITDAGRAAAGDLEPLPTGDDLLAYWNAKLGQRERAILWVLIEIYPESISHNDLAARTGYSPDASTVGAGMSKLRGLGIVDGWTLSEEFAQAIDTTRASR